MVQLNRLVLPGGWRQHCFPEEYFETQEEAGEGLPVGKKTLVQPVLELANCLPVVGQQEYRYFVVSLDLGQIDFDWA